MSKIEIPSHHTEIVGTKQIFSGGLFSGKKDLPEKEYDVLDWRWGEGRIINMKELRETGKSSYEYPTIQYLLKNEDMKRAQWSRPFPVREINLSELNED